MADTRSAGAAKVLPGGRTRAPRTDRRRRAELSAIALAGALAISALLMLPEWFGSPVARRIPQVGEISDRKLKAPDNLEIVDEEATAALRRAAVEQAPAVYDFDERRLTAVQQAVVAAFAAGRASAGKKREESELPPGAAFAAALGQNVRVPEPALETLARGRFAARDEALVLELLAPVLPRMIADDSEELTRQLGQRPILVSGLESGGEPRRLASAEGVLGVEAARSLVERRAQERLAPLEPARRAALLALAKALVEPNLRVNLRATEERRQALEAGVKPVVIALRRGEIIVRDGDPITPRHLLLLRGVQRREYEPRLLVAFLAGAFLLLLVFHVVWRFGTSSFRKFPRRRRDAAFLIAVLAVEALGTGLAAYVFDAVGDTPLFTSLVDELPSLLYFGLPVAAATMLVRLVHNAETAVLFAVVSALVAGLGVRNDLGYALFAVAGSLTAAVGAARVVQRGVLLRAGGRVGLANAAVVLGLVGLDSGASWGATGVGALLGLLSGAISGVIVSGIAPLVEWLFNYTTDIKLLELANRENALLRQLEVRAPGTYHHSMMVGHLAEKAAEAIGANALEVKVAAYYHDIGKLRRPQFFVENITIHGGENRHEKLAPSMSARIIQAHVRDGAELGAQHGLAEPIMNGIVQHHGTSVIRFFFEKAKEFADPEKGEVVHEHDYRYSGPKPQTREAGILMLADSVEAASRTLAELSQPRVQQLVQRITNNYFRDGQLDECSLTLRDLHAIARSFIDTLSAIRHDRIDYPEATDPLGRKLDEVGDEGMAERLELGSRDRPETAAGEREGDLRRLGID
jgi:putative nucleotidyltransferase with HDIG domain